MLEISYILNLGELLERTLKLKTYIWQKLKQKKNQNLKITTIDKQVNFLVLKVRTIVVAINNHMAVIQV
jgi:hypothetical protein